MEMQIEWLKQEMGCNEASRGLCVTALGLLSPSSLLAPFLPLALGLQVLVRLVGASWAPGWSLDYGPFGVCVCLVLGGQKRYVWG